MSSPGGGGMIFSPRPFCVTVPVETFLKKGNLQEIILFMLSPPGEARLAAPSMKLVNCQQEEMSRDIINTIVNKRRSSMPVTCTAFWFQITKWNALTVDTRPLLFPWWCRNISPCSCCRQTRGHCTCKLLSRGGKKKKDAMLNEARETDSIAIKVF